MTTNFTDSYDIIVCHINVTCMLFILILKSYRTLVYGVVASIKLYLICCHFFTTGNTYTHHNPPSSFFDIMFDPSHHHQRSLQVLSVCRHSGNVALSDWLLVTGVKHYCACAEVLFWLLTEICQISGVQIRLIPSRKSYYFIFLCSSRCLGI